MEPSSRLWLFFIATALQPALEQRLLGGSQKRLIARIERGRGSRAILLVHRRETMALLRFLVFRYIHLHDSEQVELGLPIETDIPTKVARLMAFDPQPVRCQAPLEYLPGHRHAAPEHRRLGRDA